jgi:hypothetical protein
MYVYCCLVLIDGRLFLFIVVFIVRCHALCLFSEKLVYCLYDLDTDTVTEHVDRFDG